MFTPSNRHTWPTVIFLVSRRVLFHLEWHMIADDGQIIVGGFFLSLLRSNVHHCFFFFLVFNFSSYSINSGPYSFFFKV